MITGSVSKKIAVRLHPHFACQVITKSCAWIDIFSESLVNQNRGFFKYKWFRLRFTFKCKCYCGSSASVVHDVGLLDAVGPVLLV